MSKGKSAKNGENDIAGEPIPAWSWIAAAAGLALVAGAAGFLLFQAFTENPTPPRFAFAVDTIAARGSGYVVETRVINTGGTAAARLVIEGVLKDGTTDVESRSITIEYVPAGSERLAGLFFTRDPRTLRLELRAVGYEQP